MLAQDELTNLDKYWHYRYRLVNYFMVVGDGPGMSIPADIRNAFDGNGSGQLRWGEGPTYLGYYLGVLATEYRLLRDNGQSTDRTLTELYYALRAVNRLDFVAESMWNLPNNEDGFLIRDDVPANFVQQHFYELNINIMPGQGNTIGTGAPGEVTSGKSDYQTNIDNGTPHLNAVSQDVIYELLMGYALVKRYVDSGNLQFNNYVTNSPMQSNFTTTAIVETSKIINYIKFHDWSMPNPDADVANISDYWVVGGNPGSMFSFNHALARVGNYITGFDFTDNITEDPAAKSAWQNLQNKSVVLCDQIGNTWSVHHMAMNLAAVSNSWRENISAMAGNTTPESIIELGDYDAGGGFPICDYFDNHFGWDVYYGMLWDVLHGGPIYIGDLCKAQQILNSGFWDGPFFHNVYDKAYPGWCSTRRFFNDPPQQNVGNSAFPGNYNGLDYMLLFNLYHLDAKEQAQPFFVPQANPFVSDHYPYLYYGPDCINYPNACTVGSISDYSEIFSPTFPVIVNQLSITANSGPIQGLGDLRIYGGPQGVSLSNTTVENQAHLDISCTTVNANCVPLQGYYFNAASYHRIANPDFFSDNSANTFEILPTYTMGEEFKASISENSLYVYPVPANQNIKIIFSIANDGTCNIYLRDVTGKKISTIYKNDKQGKGSYELGLSISDIPPGIYFCTLENEDVVIENKKIIITH